MFDPHSMQAMGATHTTELRQQARARQLVAEATATEPVESRKRRVPLLARLLSRRAVRGTTAGAVTR